MSSILAGQRSSFASHDTSALPVVDSTYVPATLVVVHHVIVGGAHIYRGYLTIPAECDSLSTSVITKGNAPTLVNVSLTVLRSNVACVSTNNTSATPFSVSFQSNANTAVVFGSMTVNNVKIPYSLVEGK